MNKNKNLILYVLFVIFSSLIFTRGVFLIFLYNKGMNFFEVSMYQAIFFIVTSIAEVPTGYIGDKYGKQKSIIIGLLLLSINAIFMIVNNFLVVFYILAMIDAIAYAFISGSDRALLYEILEKMDIKDKYLKINSYIMAIQSIVTSTAIFLGGIIVNYSWNLNYALTFISFLLATLAIIILFKNSQELNLDEEKEEIKKITYKNLKENISYKNINIFMLFFLGVSFMDGFYSAYYNLNQIIFTKMEIKVALIGTFFTIAYLVNTFVYILVEPLCQKFSKNKLYSFLLFLQGVLIIAISQSNNNVLILVISVVICAIPEMLFIIYDSIIQDNIKENYRATILSISSLILSLIAALTYFLGGIFIEKFEISLILLNLGIVISILGAISNIFIKVYKKKL